MERLGLAKYGDVFADNDIGTDILADLTEEHLKELGVSIGDRLRLLKAIRNDLGSSPEADAPASTSPVEATQPAAQASDNVERRPLTVMFCDLADSTALSTRLDPEDLQDIIRAYQETCAEHIQEYGGYIAKYMGDGILVYFGYPKSLERNAERAVRSALAIVEAMAGLNQTIGRDQDIEIAVRIGIATGTGTVMVGEVIGEGMAQERTVVGEAPNMAARLQGLAGRNGIVIGPLTKDLTGDGFECKDTGSQELKGIAGLVQTWEVLGLRDDGALEADGDELGGNVAVPELVGRDEETGLLRRAWQSVKEEGRGQVVTINGEPGIGKSVLVDGLRAVVFAEGLPQLILRCSPYHINSALHPVIEHLRRLARWQTEDSAGARFEKLEAMLEAYEQPLDEAVPLLADLLSVAVPEGRYQPLDLTPKQQKQRTQDVIVAMVLEAAERQPTLQLWEDLHWADPSTLEFIGLLIDQAPTAALLIVATARPDFVAPWQARSHITPLTLNRLEIQHAAALVARLADMKALPAEVVDHIVTKADGVPLYVEELTKTILASDILRDAGDHYKLTGPLSSLSIPDTLQESLMARLDRLPQVRELAQLGSVLGREFAYEMISGLSTADESDLQDGLGQLVDAELLYQRGRPPRARY
ncbi:MAG: Adenylate cyclase 1, partial [Alphaproteobacteria bacterium MarineAlpha10_Bin1]